MKLLAKLDISRRLALVGALIGLGLSGLVAVIVPAALDTRSAAMAERDGVEPAMNLVHLAKLLQEHRGSRPACWGATRPSRPSARPSK